jgi:hypothetical protein
MSEQNAIVPVRQALSLQDTLTLGKVLAASKRFDDATNAEQAVVKVLAGQELGFGPIASMTGIYVIKGRVTLSANMMAQAVKRSPRYDYRVVRLDDEACEIAYFERGQEIGRSLFTKQNAAAAGTQNMTKFGRNMMFARAMSNGVKWYCPDVFQTGVYTPEELGAQVDGEGEIINITPTVTTTQEPSESVDTFDPDNPVFESWGHLKAMAAKHLEHYKHPEHVTNTLKKIFNGDAEYLTFEAAWQGLQDHAASKDAEQRQADAQAALEVDAGVTDE